MIKTHMEAARLALTSAWTSAKLAEPMGELATGLFKLISDLDRLVPVEENESQLSKQETLEKEVRALLSKGEKMQAVKHYRSKTGYGLRESMYAVEHIQGKPIKWQ